MATAAIPVGPADARMPSRSSITGYSSSSIPGDIMPKSPQSLSQSQQLVSCPQPKLHPLPPKEPRSPLPSQPPQTQPPPPTKQSASTDSSNSNNTISNSNNTSNSLIIKRTPSAPKLSESKSLANEAQDLLNRPANAGAARRCASYTPTLKELSSVSFSDYIRGEVLGVPLPGYEFLYVYEDPLKETKQHKGGVGSVPLSLSHLAAVSNSNAAAGDICSACSPIAATATATATATASNGLITPAPSNEGKDDSTATDPIAHTPSTPASQTMATIVSSSALPSSMSTSMSTPSPMPTTSLDTQATPPPSASAPQQQQHQQQSLQQQSSQQPQVAVPPKKEAAPPTKMRTRSQSRQGTPNTTTTTIVGGGVMKNNTHVNGHRTTSASRSNGKNNGKGAAAAAAAAAVVKKSNIPLPKKYQMCWYKLRDGIAKVSLPLGFWAKLDTTARGRHWAKGSKLGDTMIPSPIKQCLSGIGGVYEYTLIEQPSITVSEFRTKADEYRKRQIGKEFDTETKDEFFDDLARKFWRRLGPTMEPAVYGADMEGTLFKDAHACGWNVNRLESCLQLLRADAKGGDRDDEVFHLPGVTSAYLYFGMWASAFAAHTEDMNLLSINYLHAGSPKYWYAIAPEDSKRFETLARSHFPGQANECNEFMRHKRCLLSPAILKKAGIKFTTCIQRPGDAIITFPGSYHFGFNTGFNIAESTNFAVPEWIPIGEKASFCMCVPHSVRIQMKRLKSLLDEYEKDMCYRTYMGLSQLSYSSWAKHEARRIKKEFRASAGSGSKKGSDNEGVDSSLDSLELPTAYNKGIAVEITKETITSKKSKRKSFKRKEYNEWRLAKRARPGAFVPHTDVIILVDCHDSNGSEIMHAGNDYEFFIGTIVKVLDGHVRVHLTGLGKKEDIWFEQDSLHLFLDGGVTEAPSSSEEEEEEDDERNTKSSQKKRRR